jgi:hypothetical protein
MNASFSSTCSWIIESSGSTIDSVSCISSECRVVDEIAVQDCKDSQFDVGVSEPSARPLVVFLQRPITSDIDSRLDTSGTTPVRAACTIRIDFVDEHQMRRAIVRSNARTVEFSAVCTTSGGKQTVDEYLGSRRRPNTYPQAVQETKGSTENVAAFHNFLLDIDLMRPVRAIILRLHFPLDEIKPALARIDLETAGGTSGAEPRVGGGTGLDMEEVMSSRSHST